MMVREMGKGVEERMLDRCGWEAEFETLFKKTLCSSTTIIFSKPLR